MNPWLQNTLIAALIAGYACMEYVSRRYRDTVRATANDTKLELLMFISLVAITQPIALMGANALCSWLVPGQRGAFAALPWWAMVGVFLVVDDLTQYAWHRLSHTPLLWPLHRAHHSASYMSIRVTYRNNFFYYLLMPGLWMGGVLVFLGMGKVYVPYLVVKIAVILGAHCAWRWDEPLYRVKALRPLMWVVERTISTPATHWAHHALTNSDGIGHYRGNFGNLLFFWDVLLGTAHITRRYPAAVGLQDDRLFGDEHWADQMFYPLLQSKREHSALRPGGRPYEEAPPAELASAETGPGRGARRRPRGLSLISVCCPWRGSPWPRIPLRGVTTKRQRGLGASRAGGVHGPPLEDRHAGSWLPRRLRSQRDPGARGLNKCARPRRGGAAHSLAHLPS